MADKITSVEILSKQDYKTVEVLGLLPTDRDPSAWLRMVARTFAAYKGVDVTKSISAYIDGFHILNDIDDIKTHNHGFYTFIIEKGSGFIDDQFIGFKDNVLVKYPKQQFLPNHEYWIVLQYNWLLQADYNMAYFEVIPPDLFVDGEMIKIRGFKINTAGDIELLPDDLDDQFANNFKKIFELSSEKVMDSIESISFQYLNYDPTENKFDISCKSGDFVYLDYITGKYFPARSCTKRLDKAVGLYLKDITNNKDYVIHSGFVDFSNTRWSIHPDRIYLKNLEPGASYFLADNCVIGDVANPFYNDTLAMSSTDPGKISTKFYPGLVRTGYAVEHDKMYIQLDYTTEMDTQNLLELFGDKERFDIRYQDYYKYYALLEDQKFIINKIAEKNSSSSALTTEIENLKTAISTQQTTLTDSYTNYTSKKDALQNNIDNYDNTDNFKNIFYRYSYNIQYNMINEIYNDKLFNNMGYLSDNYSGILNNLITDITSIVTNDAKDNYNDSTNTSNTENLIGLAINNVKVDIGDLFNNVNLLTNLIADDNQVNDTDNNINTKSLKTIFNDYSKKSITTDNFILNLKKFYDVDDDGKESGFFKIIENNINDNLVNLNTDFEPISYYIFDISNDLIYVFSMSYSKIEHTYYKTDEILDTDLIFDETKLENDSSNPNILQSNSDYESNSTKNSITGTYSISPNTNKYIKLESYDKLKIIFDKTIFNAYQIKSLINYLKQIILEIISKISEYKTNEPNINVIQTYTDSIDSSLDTFNTKKQDLSDNHKDTLIQIIKLYDLNQQKSNLDSLETKLNNNITTYTNELANLNNQITEYKTSLGDDLDFNIPTKSIFMINNYERIIYNYTYITNRLKIKYTEQKVVEDRIKISKNALTEVLSKVPVNKALEEQLENLIASYNALLNEINNEIKSLTDEYNIIRIGSLGLDPIAHDDPNFSDDGYAIYDLDCLNSVE